MDKCVKNRQFMGMVVERFSVDTHVSVRILAIDTEAGGESVIIVGRKVYIDIEEIN